MILDRLSVYSFWLYMKIRRTGQAYWQARLPKA